MDLGNLQLKMVRQRKACGVKATNCQQTERMQSLYHLHYNSTENNFPTLDFFLISIANNNNNNNK